MNNKGFTLVELLATIVILGVITGVAVYGTTTAINNSKLKSERLFTQKIGDSVKGYLSYYGSTSLKEKTGTINFTKCLKINNSGNCEETKNASAKELVQNIAGTNSLTLKKTLATSLKTTNESDLVNPKNKKNCVVGKDPVIRVFKDSDYVYYYYLNLKGNNTSCDITNENAVVTNIPKGLCTALSGTYDNDKGCSLS